jgi:YopJ Serine/Threonine acetyltransferase
MKHYPQLTGYLDQLELAYRQNRNPTFSDYPYLDDMIRGLNAADPTLRLERHDFSPERNQSEIAQSTLAQQLRQGLRSGQALRVLLDDGLHRTALGIRFSDASNHVSLVLVDGSDLEPIEAQTKSWEKALALMTGSIQALLAPDEQPIKMHLLLARTVVQKTLTGCSIFALSATKKLASEPFVAALHDKALSAMQSSQVAPAVRCLPGTDLPAAFFKHTTSRTVLTGYLNGKRLEYAKALQPDAPDQSQDLVNPEAAVNKKKQTLLQRYEAHVVDRNFITYSNSYELKRIEFVRNALHHLTAGLSNSSSP